MVCPPNDDGKCNFYDCRPRRRLTTGTSFRGDEPEFRAHVDTCGAYDYDSFLFVDTHLYAVAAPKEKATAAGCPFVVVHAILEDHNGAAARKELMVWEDREEGQALFPEDDSILMGTYQFSDLIRAYDETDPSVDGAYYDIVSNNCGNFMVNLGSKLDVKINAGLTTEVARRLLKQSGKAFVEKIRSNVNYYSLFQGRHLRSDQATDEEVMELLVEAHASKLY